MNLESTRKWCDVGFSPTYKEQTCLFSAQISLSCTIMTIGYLVLSKSTGTLKFWGGAVGFSQWLRLLIGHGLPPHTPAPSVWESHKVQTNLECSNEVRLPCKDSLGNVLMHPSCREFGQVVGTRFGMSKDGGLSLQRPLQTALPWFQGSRGFTVPCGWCEGMSECAAGTAHRAKGIFRKQVKWKTFVTCYPPNNFYVKNLFYGGKQPANN